MSDPYVIVILTGTFTLLGVGLGGALDSIGTTRAERRRNQNRLRTSARLVAEELDRSYQVIEASLQFGGWTPMGNAPLTQELWRSHMAVLGELVTDHDDWEEIRHAQRLVAMIARVHGLGEPKRPFSPADPRHLEDARDQARIAADILDRIARSTA